MIANQEQLLTTLEQLDRMMLVIDDLTHDVLPENPRLFAAMVEGPIDQIAKLRLEIAQFVDSTKAAG